MSRLRTSPEIEGRGETGRPVSVVIPVAERPGPLSTIYREHAAALEKAGYRPEFIFVVEPPYRDRVTELETLRGEGHPIQILRAGQVVGESSLLKAGAQQARSPTVLTLPPYWRIVPEELPKVLDTLEKGKVDIVMARRWPRRDSWLNRLQNRAYHVLLQPAGTDAVHDVACGVRALPRNLLLELPLYGDFHRFLPMIARREGYRVTEINTSQHPDDQSARVYGPGVYVRRIIDILGIHFLLRFTEKPLRFFGLLGSILSLAGAVILAILAVQQIQGQAIADRPMLLLGTLLLVLGVQAVALGLVGEIIVHLSAPDRRPYRLLRDDAPSVEITAPPPASEEPSAEPDPGRSERPDLAGRG